MADHPPFNIICAPQTKSHLYAIERKYYTLIRKTIDAQLQFEPLSETKNRQPLSRPAEFGADWELRCGPRNRFRVFYEVIETEREVHIIAIGVKRKNRLLIGREEVEL